MSGGEECGVTPKIVGGGGWGRERTESWSSCWDAPGWVGVFHRAPPSRFGYAKSSLLLELEGSPPVPHVGVKGTPSLAVNITPSSHPSVIQRVGPENDFAVGISHVPFPTTVRPTLKSEKPRANFMSNQSKLETQLLKASPARVAELVSILLPHVKVPCI